MAFLALESFNVNALDLSERSLVAKFSTNFIMHARIFFFFDRNVGAQQYKT